MNGTENTPAREPHVATVSSPSSNATISISITTAGRNRPLVGKTVAVTNTLGGSEEIAIGAVTKVTTRNRWHDKDGFAGIQGDNPDPDLSGDGADTRDATIHLQACWQRTAGDKLWKQSGPYLHMSPATGVPVLPVNQHIVSEIVEGVEGVHYCGHLGGTDQVPLPLNIPEFSGRLGAFHTGLFGRNGSGKTAITSYLLASQMRHRDFGILVVDPQGQWSSETELPFSLQGFAAEIGRTVEVKRISEDLRLTPDPELFVTLLRHTNLIGKLGRLNPDSQSIIADEMSDIVRKTRDWHTSEVTSAGLLRTILEGITSDDFVARLFSSEPRRDMFHTTAGRLLDDEERFTETLYQFAPVHNLFQSRNPDGGERTPLKRVLGDVFERHTRKAVAEPAPYTVLDMSSAAPKNADVELTAEQRGVLEVLEKATIKAAILRHVFGELKTAAEDKFRNGTNLNTLIVLDEAWRFAPPPNTAENDEIEGLSNDLAGYSRDTRKFGIGWFYITQSPKSIHGDIFDQMSVRIFGFGLTGTDLGKVREIVADESSLDLYRAFGDPRSTGVWPFLLTGPVSPLLANNSPIVLEAFTDFDDFRRSNSEWLAPIYNYRGVEPPTGKPASPQPHRVASPRNRRPLGPVQMRQLADSNDAVRRNRADLGLTDPDRDPFTFDPGEAPF